MTPRLLAALGLALGLLGCGAQPRSASESAPQPPAVRASAATPVENAAHAADGMCLEHGVLEAVCTACNPRLIPIFQAKGDWCAEHGFPESFCPRCHPERGGRPATDVTEDPAPADGTRVRFRTLAAAREAGIETVAAVAGSGQDALVVTARIVADPARLARVNAGAPGVVRALQADIGARVARGDALAIIESAAVAADRARLETARARARVAEAAYHREKELQAGGISALKEVQAAQREFEEARAEVAAAEAALGMLGAAEGGSGAYTLRAPIGGVVTRRDFNIGSLVEAQSVLFEIIDTSRLWAEMDVPEAAAARVSVGQRVLLEVEDLPERRFEATIGYVAPLVDDRTRTVLARAALDNRDGALRANVYGRAHLAGGASTPAVLIPRAALQEAKGVQLVFVRLTEDEFTTRRVTAGPAEGAMVAIAEGLRPGEPVVTTGSFLLKTETLKESIGAGCCDVAPPK